MAAHASNEEPLTEVQGDAGDLLDPGEIPSVQFLRSAQKRGRLGEMDVEVDRFDDIRWAGQLPAEPQATQ